MFILLGAALTVAADSIPQGAGLSPWNYLVAGADVAALYI